MLKGSEQRFVGDLHAKATGKMVKEGFAELARLDHALSVEQDTAVLKNINPKGHDVKKAPSPVGKLLRKLGALYQVQL